MKSRAKEIKGKVNKQLLMERYLEIEESLSNREIAELMSKDYVETSEEYVRVMRNRYKRQIMGRITDLSRLVRDKEVADAIKRGVIKVSSDIVNKDLEEKHTVQLFGKVLEGQ